MEKLNVVTSARWSGDIWGTSEALIPDSFSETVIAARRWNDTCFQSFRVFFRYDNHFHITALASHVGIFR
jgi:hypothetical protein